MRILTTGVSSGIGKCIYESIGGIGLTRETVAEKIKTIKQEGANLIIHCAFNSKKEITSESIYSYFADSVFLTKDLVTFPHKKFIYLSTTDLYPKNDYLHSEEEVINADSIKCVYGITKLVSESIVQTWCKNFLILRLTSLLGAYMRKNTLSRLIEDKDCSITLSANSTFNFALYSDILDFINFAIKNDIKGIYNVASSGNINLSEVAHILEKKVEYGTYTYNVGNISNKKICHIFPIFRKSSTKVLKEFLG